MIVLFPSCAFLSETTRMLAIYRALRARWRHAPLSFFAPTRGSV
jgi:hypothetical protein